MPTYDVECSECGFAATVVLKLAELDAWDASRACPTCQGGSSKYRRVVRKAPATIHGASNGSRFRPAKTPGFSRSSESDSMRHQQGQRADRDQIAAARESVKKGEFEGF